MDGKIESLPKWAQDRIANLEEDLRGARRLTDGLLAEGTYTPTERGVYLPDSLARARYGYRKLDTDRVRFIMDDGPGAQAVDVQFSRDEDERDRVQVRVLDGRLVILPNSANAIEAVCRGFGASL